MTVTVPYFPITPDQPEIPYLGSFETYAALGLVRVMEPETEFLMQERAQRELAFDEHDSPHERPWYVSYHASQFPGKPADACKRRLLYRMMNIPAGEAMPPWVTATGVVGKAGELDLARAWYEGARLLAVPEDEDIRWARVEAAFDAMRAGDLERAQDLSQRTDVHQLGFVDSEHWMTASTDLPILPKGWTRPYIVEVKGKADDVLEQMINGEIIINGDGTAIKRTRGPDHAHVNQLKATIGLASKFDWGNVSVCPTCWRILASELLSELLTGERSLKPLPWSDAYYYCRWCKDYSPQIDFHLDPPTSGEIYYWSRSWPRKTKSFYYELDTPFMDGGLQVLAETRQHFLSDELPPRPSHFQWAIGPCGQCPFKKFCRLDSGLAPRARTKITLPVINMLSESNGIEYARTMRPSYDFESVRARVISEWEEQDG